MYLQECCKCRQGQIVLILVIMEWFHMRTHACHKWQDVVILIIMEFFT